MDGKAFAASFWRHVAAQEAEALRAYFAPDACIRWHNTNEWFTVDEYVTANCEYPGAWEGKVERVEQTEALLTTVTRVWLTDGSASFHAVSFFQFRAGKIAALDEYWGDDGPAPPWRIKKQIGRPIEPAKDEGQSSESARQNA